MIVVGGGNSAGQAAVFLAATTKRVHLLVRSPGLDDTDGRNLVEVFGREFKAWSVKAEISLKCIDAERLNSERTLS